MLFCYSRARELDAEKFQALSSKRRGKFDEHLDSLFDEFLKSQDAYIAFNFMDDPGREYFPIAEAEDDEIARIELPPDDFPKAIAHHAEIVSRIQATGYRFVTLDLAGFRSGGMNGASAVIPLSELLGV